MWTELSSFVLAFPSPFSVISNLSWYQSPRLLGLSYWPFVIQLDKSLYWTIIPNEDCLEVGMGRVWNLKNLFTGRASASCGSDPCFMLFFFVFLIVLGYKNKGKERSARGPAYAGSCQCGPEIKFLTWLWQARDPGNGQRSGLERTRVGSGPNRVGPTQPILASRIALPASML